MSHAPTRIEHDLLGDRAVPADAYYGIHTLRALENFRITGRRSRSTRSSYARSPASSRRRRSRTMPRLLPDEKADAIARACEEVREGKLLDQFVVDVVQAGRGPRQQ